MIKGNENIEIIYYEKVDELKNYFLNLFKNIVI